MVVEPRKKDAKQAQPSKKALMISIGAHVVVFFLIIFGLPHFKDDPIIADPVPVELIANVGELTTTNKKPAPAKPVEKPKEEPPKKVEKEIKEKPKSSTPPPPDESALKTPTKDTEKKPVKKPEPKKEQEKKPNQNDFDSLLKDLTPDEKPEKQNEEAEGQNETPEPAPNVSRFSDILSISEMDALRQQLSQCWNIMAGAANAEDQVVEVAVEVNMDRTVSSAKVVDQGKYSSNPFFRAAADSALRALRNPSCTPLNVPPNKYESWKKMTIVFDPKEMLY